ncbi:hypothetical protein T492DRAFT_847510 [Pavlovales sp. CCMP2436]|nr:hypothetical protein T492DRAFT_847510 [Pavlovales sp. CCMP2436]
MPYTMSRGISNYNNTPRDTPTPSTPPPHRQYSGGTLTAGTPGRQHPGVEEAPVQGDSLSLYLMVRMYVISSSLVLALHQTKIKCYATYGSFKRGAFQSELGRGWSSTSPSGSLRAGGGDQNSSGETVRLSRGRRDSPGQSLKGWGEARDSLGGSSRTGGESRSSPEGSLRAGGEAMNSPGGSLRAGGGRDEFEQAEEWLAQIKRGGPRQSGGIAEVAGSALRGDGGGGLDGGGPRQAGEQKQTLVSPLPSSMTHKPHTGYIGMVLMKPGSSSALSLPEVGAAESARVLSASLVLTSAPASVPYFAEAIDENERASASLRSSLSSLPVPPPVVIIFTIIIYYILL